MTPIVMYSTAYCPYCIRAKNLLEKKQVEYTELRVDLDTELREEMYQRSNRFTVPQIFIGDYHVGGFDELHRLELNNELDALLFPSKDI